MEHYLKQNNAIDIYENYFSSDGTSAIDTDPPSAKTISIFRYSMCTNIMDGCKICMGPKSSTLCSVVLLCMYVEGIQFCMYHSQSRFTY